MSHLIINASPRKNGTSAMVADECEAFLKAYNKNSIQLNLYSHDGSMDTIMNAVKDSDTVIISGPCYINTYPAGVTNLLQQIGSRPEVIHNQKLYGIIQGGMPYSHTHKSGLNMLEVFADQEGMQYCGGFIFGLGAMLDGKPLDALPNGRKVKRQLNIFFENIYNGVFSEDEVYERAFMRLPKLLSKIIVRSMNKNIDSSYEEIGLDASAPSPYMFDELQ